MPVHVHLLVESGIHIIECFNLEELSAAGVREFPFVAIPLKIRGATASPIRPVAVVWTNRSLTVTALWRGAPLPPHHQTRQDLHHDCQ